ncbi:MAG: hypothetical protein KBT21_11545 [Treponema sp.]|nr:hypothetical protein [Candidatus Treponema merdequi]
MRYTTREIINRALKLTDFNDDFFIGNRELTHLLNDNWYEAYSILVNKEDKTFLKTAILMNEDLLPYDMFKLHAVKDDNNNIMLKEQDYDIIGNRLILKHKNSAKIEFYSNPHPLCLKNTEKELMNYNGVITKWEDGYIFADKVSDFSGSNLQEISTVNTYLSNGYILNNVVYGYNRIPYTEKKLIEGNEITYDTVNLNSSVENVIAVITNKAHSFFYFLDNSGNLYTQNDELIMSGFSPKTMYCKADGLYFVENNVLKRVLGKEVENFPTGVYSVNGILDEDDAVFFIGENYYRKGYGFDSLLEVPSQLFWSYFAYSIAESICNVVQRDPAAIAAKKEEIKALFLESLQNDNNASYQIRNTEDYRTW